MNDETTFQLLATALRGDGIAVVRTDTIYGLLARVDSEAAVAKVYDTKHRDPSKQCIILISTAAEAGEYADVVRIYSEQASEPTSVIVPVQNEPAWVTRGGDTIAYRVVRSPLLKRLIDEVGPVIAPSANPEGLPPASTIAEAADYFGDAVDYYCDGGEVAPNSAPSHVIRVELDGSVVVVRD